MAKKPKTIPCKYACGSMFATVESAANHHKKKHPIEHYKGARLRGAPLLQCPYCSKFQSTKNSHWKHKSVCTLRPLAPK